MEKLKTLLKSLGLEHKETDVYLTALQLGTSPASSIGKRCDIPRATAHYTCDQLVKKQLMIVSKQGNTKYFTAEAPEKLEHIIRMEEIASEKKREELNFFIPQLNQLFNPHTVLPKVTFYEGVQAIERAYEIVLNDIEEGETVYHYLSPIDPTSKNPEYEILNSFTHDRVKKKGLSHVIAPDTELSKILKTYDKEYLRETRLNPDPGFSFPPSRITISKNTMFSLAKKETFFAYVLQSEAIVALHRAAFESLWKRLG